jgi:site-specific DNA recombinase
VVEPVYEDNDLSALSGRRRPGYEQLLADAKAGRINVIVAWHADRLTRQPIENEALIALVERRAGGGRWRCRERHGAGRWSG